MSKTKNPRCPMCGGNNFSIIDGYLNPIIQPSEKESLTIGHGAIPCAATLCTQCGFLSYHALGILEDWSKKKNNS